MGNNKKPGPGPSVGETAKDRHNKERKVRSTIDWTVPAPAELVARLDQPKSNPKRKHQSYLEWVENADKKKKLEFQTTSDTQPPPGFEFVPIGNPDLTRVCKDMSRDKEAMMFIVAIDSRTGFTHREDMVQELGRIGYHFRQTIVDEARESLGLETDCYLAGHNNLPEPIPQTQAEINQQADAAIRDLFPRIPNTDRQAVVDRAFKINDKKVGTFSKLNLSKRVQLAVLAHIRHNYTRYDRLLRETNWENARKAVESLCLDYLVKWRGDEENGRDQLDEVLREVIVISDSDSDDDSGDDDDSSDGASLSDSSESVMDGSFSEAVRNTPAAIGAPEMTDVARSPSAQVAKQPRAGGTGKARHSAQKGKWSKKNPGKHSIKKQQRVAKVRANKEANTASRGFKRYQAVRDQAWHDAVQRQRHVPQPARTAGPASRDGQAPGYTSGAWDNPHGDVSHKAHHDPRDAPVPAHSRQGYDIAPSQQPPPREPYKQRGPLPSASTSRSGPPGPQASFNNYSYREHVGHTGDGLRDYLVKSIEPSSPNKGSFPRGIPQRNDTPPQPAQHNMHSFDRGARQLSPAPYAQGFIQLSPREPRSIGNSRRQPEGSRTYAPVSGASSAPQGYVTVKREDDQALQTNSELPGAYHDGAGTKVNPIVLPSSPLPRQYPEAPTRAQPSSLSSGPLQGQPIARVIDFRTRSLASPPPQRREPSTGFRSPWFGDGVPAHSSEIVRVTNKFPRRYELQPAHSPAPRYDLRSTHRPTVERVVRRVEEPIYRNDRFPSSSQAFGGSSAQPHRQERVVAVEYIPVESGTRDHSYGSERLRPSYNGPPPEYRSRAHQAPAGPGAPRPFYNSPSFNY